MLVDSVTRRTCRLQLVDGHWTILIARKSKKNLKGMESDLDMAKKARLDLTADPADPPHSKLKVTILTTHNKSI